MWGAAEARGRRAFGTGIHGRVGCWLRVCLGGGYFPGNGGLVGYGYEGLGPRFRGDDGGVTGVTEVPCWTRYGVGEGYFPGNDGLVGYGDGGLGPRFRGDDGGVAGVTEGWRERQVGLLATRRRGCWPRGGLACWPRDGLGCWRRVCLEMGYFHGNDGFGFDKCWDSFSMGG